MNLDNISPLILNWFDELENYELINLSLAACLLLIFLEMNFWQYHLLHKLNDLQQSQTKLKQVNHYLQENQKLLDLFFSQSLDGIFLMMLDEPVQWDDTVDKEKILDYVFDHQRITKVNQTMLDQYGATEEQLLGLTPRDCFAHDLAQGKQIWRNFFDAGRLRCETFERKLDHTPMWIEGDYLCLYNTEGKIRGHFGIQRDISDRKHCEAERKKTQQEIELLNQKLTTEVQRQTKVLNQTNQKLQEEITKYQQAQEQLKYDALHDHLTGLPNRNLLIDRLGHLIERSQNHPQQKFAVLFLDVDRFKVINDSLGHLLGDQLLIALVNRLQQCQRRGDTIARIGGDEFVILLEELTCINEAIQVSQKIQQKLSLPFKLENHEIFISVSIGITYNSELYTQPIYLLRNADLAMYYAKTKGKARYEIFNPAMHSIAMKKLALENQLKRVISNKELIVYYQPIIALEDNLLVGFEALVRWQTSEKNLISPQDFIPLAENIGIIIDIDLWVLREACLQLRFWQEQGLVNTPLSVAVNLSAKHFSQPDFIEQIDVILTETRLEGQYLKLEITENVLIENTKPTIEILKQLQQRKIKVCLDDFGTGYSSLSYLQYFPINKIKIDRSFVSQIDNNSSNHTIVRAMIMIAHELNIEVIAEGIETLEQLKFLNLLGCQYVQGYWFSPPQNSKKIELWLKSFVQKNLPNFNKGLIPGKDNKSNFVA
ncbi:response regulator receiver modulated diguanylate cyclase/phosphodiesterase with PAS/PAC sensor [Stanieria sp. NIES-3757]|nr:response regulator receiver modulated diguanylate cyclase/phosphodiesterase with PAS/PAC sensor [Stanieria sp. NIES-3757]